MTKLALTLPEGYTILASHQGPIDQPTIWVCCRDDEVSMELESVLVMALWAGSSVSYVKAVTGSTPAAALAEIAGEVVDYFQQLANNEMLKVRKHVC